MIHRAMKVLKAEGRGGVREQWRQVAATLSMWVCGKNFKEFFTIGSF